MAQPAMMCLGCVTRMQQCPRCHGNGFIPIRDAREPTPLEEEDTLPIPDGEVPDGCEWPFRSNKE